MTSLMLTGLDAQNPLAFLAALGLLRILDDHAVRHAIERPRLSFIDEGRQTPKLWTALSMKEVAGIVLEDATTQAMNPALRIAYDENGNEVSPEASGATRDLKPPPKLARVILDRGALADRRTADLLAGFFSDLVQDVSKGRTKPTAFHFTAGQQVFLKMVDALRRGIAAGDVNEALSGPWLNRSKLPSLSWDASITRLYALRAGDPSIEKRGSIAAANWLGVNALSFFPVNVLGTKLVTARVEGGWKGSSFTWPVWEARLSVPTIAALLRVDPRPWRSEERAAQGITGVFSSRILRAEQGGNGSFCPAEVVLPTSKKKQG